MCDHPSSRLNPFDEDDDQDQDQDENEDDDEEVGSVPE